MRHFFAASLGVCALLGIGAFTQAETTAAVGHIVVKHSPAPPRDTAVRHITANRSPAATVRHIAISHSPAPPLSTVEISNSKPTPTIVPPPQGATTCVGSPPASQAAGPTCSPQPQPVEVTVVQIPVQ